MKQQLEEKDYNDFFNHFERFEHIRKKQKQRGLNDFNLLTTVLKYSDEVRLHSRMIGSLLNPQGKHYQDTLFLEIFLKEVGLEHWGLNLSNTTVHIEYKDIDLYITDKNKHIIIENKIWADDQPCQIMKYINIIFEENKESFDLSTSDDGHIVLDEDMIRVLYLTPRAKKVSSAHARDSNGYIYFKGEKNSDEELQKCSKKSNTKLLVPAGLKKYKVKYEKIKYKKEIIRWLYAAQKEVRNISNLVESLQQYIDVVRRVNKNFEGNVMSLKEYVENNKMNLSDLFTVKDEIEKLQGSLFYDFFSQEIDGLSRVNEKIKETDEKYKKFIYTKPDCFQFFRGNSRDFGTFYEIDDDYLLYIVIGISYIHYGIVKHKNYKLINSSENDESFGLQYRKKGFRNLKWFSQGYPLKDNLDVFDNYTESKFVQNVSELIQKINKENNE